MNLLKTKFNAPLAAPPGGGWMTNAVAATNAQQFFRLHLLTVTNSPVPSAPGITATDCLDVGAHTIRLVVSDTHGASGTNAVTVEVIMPCEASGIAIDCVNNSDLPRNRVRPLIASLTAACASFDRGNVTSALNQLHAFQNKVDAQVAPSNPALAQKLIDTAPGHHRCIEPA